MTEALKSKIKRERRTLAIIKRNNSKKPSKIRSRHLKRTEGAYKTKGITIVSDLKKVRTWRCRCKSFIERYVMCYNLKTLKYICIGTVPIIYRMYSLIWYNKMIIC